VTVGAGGRQRRPVAAEERLDLVDRGRRDEVGAGDLPDRHRVPVDDERSAVDGVDGGVGADLQAGRVGDPLDAVVDDGDRAPSPVVDDDHVPRLVDVVVGAGIGHADRGGDLADDAVDVTHVPLVALEQPRAAVVGVGLRPFAALGLQGGDDDGADDESEHDEHAAGDAAPSAPRHGRSCCAALSVTAAPAWV